MLTLLLDNLVWRWREWRERPVYDYMSPRPGERETE